MVPHNFSFVIVLEEPLNLLFNDIFKKRFTPHVLVGLEGLRYVGVIRFLFHDLQLRPIRFHNKTCVASTSIR
jgi:hypothetical protein